MSKSAVYVRHKALPGKRDEVQRVWENYARAYVDESSRQLAYFYCYDNDDPDTIVVFQLCADQAGAEDFVKQPWFSDYQAETAALLADQSELRTATPQWIKGDAA